MYDKKTPTRRRISHKERERLAQEAKSKDIFAVAQQLGMKLQGNGKAEWEGHDSFWLDRKKNRFQWYGKGLWGDPVTLVSVIKFGARSVEDYKKNYRQSIAYLTNTEVPQFDPSKIPKFQPFKYYLKDAASMQLATDYLINERGLALETVQFFKEKGVLTQSVWRNKREDGSTFPEPVVVFKHFDSNNKMIGGSVQGIEYHPELHTDHKSGHLKRVLKNSGGYSGLAVDIGQPQRLVVCEAPIDLLSYYELHKETLKDVKLISSDGYKPHVLSRYVAEMYGNPEFSLSEKEKFLEKFDKLSKNMSGYPDNLITFAYDNDEAGRGFVEQFKMQYSNAENYTAIDLPPLKVGTNKADWNDELQTIKKEGTFMENNHFENYEAINNRGTQVQKEMKEYTVKEEKTQNYSLKISKTALEKNTNQQTKTSEVHGKETGQPNPLDRDPDIKRYEQIIQEQQDCLNQLQTQFTELTKQNVLILEKLNQKLAENTEDDKNVKQIGLSTKELTFVQIPRLIQQSKEKLSEVKNYLKDNIKFKSQKGLSVAFEKLKVLKILETIKKGLDSLSQKVQNLETQLKVLSGNQVDEKELLLLPAPILEAAEEIVKRKNVKIGESTRPRNKFEERLQKANETRKVVEEKLKRQPQQTEQILKSPKI